MGVRTAVRHHTDVTLIPRDGFAYPHSFLAYLLTYKVKNLLKSCNNILLLFFFILKEVDTIDDNHLALKAPYKNCSRRHFNFLLLSSKKIRLDFSCESSA